MSHIMFILVLVELKPTNEGLLWHVTDNFKQNTDKCRYFECAFPPVTKTHKFSLYHKNVFTVGHA